MVPEFAATSPVHCAFANQSIETLPVGIGEFGCPVTVTKSWTVAPASTDVTTACAALWMSVAVCEASCSTSVWEPAVFVNGPAEQLLLVPLQRSLQLTDAVSASSWFGSVKSAA